MRKEIALGLDGRTVIVRELRVRDMRKLLERMQDLQGLADTPLPVLLNERLPELLAFVGECVVLPPDLPLDDLSLSECVAIKDAWWGLHKDFFAPLVAIGRARLAGGMPLPPSIAPASPVSSAATPGSGTTAGPST